MQRGVRRCGDAALVQPDQQLGIERIEAFVVEAARVVAEADDVGRDGREHFQVGLRRDQRGELMRLRDVAIDQAAEAVEAVLLDRQPDLQRAEAA